MALRDGECRSYSEFVDTDEEIDVNDNSEPLERYENGLYCPVCIGEVLAGRYRREHNFTSLAGGLF